MFWTGLARLTGSWRKPKMVIVPWVLLPEPLFERRSFKIQPGKLMPTWLHNAFVAGSITPLPLPDPDDDEWGQDGIYVIATRKVFPIGSKITKADLKA